MAIGRNVNDFRNTINLIAEKYKPIHEGERAWDDCEAQNSDNNVPDYNLKLPPWLCQPYYRKSPEEREREKAMEMDMNASEVKEVTTKSGKDEEKKRKKQYYDRDGNVTTKKNLKKLKRLERTARLKNERKGVVCEAQRCGQNRSKKCDHQFCGNCCKAMCLKKKIACVGHKIMTENNNSGQDDKQQMMMEILKDD